MAEQSSPRPPTGKVSFRWGAAMEKKSHLESYDLFLNICKGMSVVTALVLLLLLFLWLLIR